jgi:hypothetical protein
MIDQGSDTPTQRLDLALVDESASATAADSLKARLLGIPDLALTPGTELGRFVLLAQIGAGGMGVVYAAYDPELDRKVAVKLVQTARERGPATRGRSRLLHEAQAMARLSHPNVIAVYETGTVGDQVFLAMEFVKGVTLAQWLRQAPRDWRAVVAAFVQAGRGLAAAHAAGIVHRDFKPTGDPRSRIGARITAMMRITSTMRITAMVRITSTMRITAMVRITSTMRITAMVRITSRSCGLPIKA